jgi:hypothetical protein
MYETGCFKLGLCVNFQLKSVDTRHFTLQQISLLGLAMAFCVDEYFNKISTVHILQ